MQAGFDKVASVLTQAVGKNNAKYFKANAVDADLAKKVRRIARKRPPLSHGTHTNTPQIRNGLSSSSEHESLDAMKHLIAQMCQSVDVLDFFPSVVKNAHAQSIQLRRLVCACFVSVRLGRPGFVGASLSCGQFSRRGGALKAFHGSQPIAWQVPLSPE